MVTGVNDLDSFNAAAFIEHVDKPVTRYVIRNKEESVLLEKIKKEPTVVKMAESVETLEETNIKTDKNGQDDN